MALKRTRRRDAFLGQISTPHRPGRAWSMPHRDLSRCQRLIDTPTDRCGHGRGPPIGGTAMTLTPRSVSGLEVRGPQQGAHAAILTGDALDFVADLVRDFAARAATSSSRGAASGRRRFDAGERPHFLAGDGGRPRGDWTVAPLPAGPPRPPRRDHRPGRPQDDHQRAQLRARASSWPTSRTRTRPTWDNVVERPGQPARRGARARSASTTPRRASSYALERERRRR